VVQSPPTQPFDRAELLERIERAQRLMEDGALDALLITSQPNIYYLSGFATKGVSTAKYLLLARDGRGLLVIPSIETGNADRDLAGLPIERYVAYEPAFAAVKPPWQIVQRSLEEWGLSNGTVGVELKEWPASVWSDFTASDNRATYKDVTGAIDELRMLKSPRELEYMRSAAKIADAVSASGTGSVKEGATEAEIATAMLTEMIASGGEPPAGLGNVRIGKRTGLVHTGWSDTAARAGDHVYLEFSGAVARYHTVLWRTVFVGDPHPERERLARAMRSAHDQALALLKPGLRFRELDAVQRAVIADAGYADQMFPFSGYAVGIALPTSWLGTLIAKDSDRAMEANMTFHMGIFMLKPGEWGMALSQAVLVTESGCEALTKSDSGPYFN
jgi:Xaa-Pro aminopeptidase